MGWKICVSKWLLFITDVALTFYTAYGLVEHVKTFTKGNEKWPLAIPIFAWIAFGINSLQFLIKICCECGAGGNYSCESNGEDKEESECCSIFSTILTWLSFIAFAISCGLFGYNIDNLKTKGETANKDFSFEIFVTVVKFVISIVISCIHCYIKKNK